MPAVKGPATARRLLARRPDGVSTWRGEDHRDAHGPDDDQGNAGAFPSRLAHLKRGELLFRVTVNLVRDVGRIEQENRANVVPGIRSVVVYTDKNRPSA